MKKVKLLVSVALITIFAFIMPLAHANAQSVTSVPLPKEGTEMIFEDGVSAKILVDNAKERVVETEDESNIYVVSYNKDSQEMTFETYDLDRNLLKTESLDEYATAEEEVTEGKLPALEKSLVSSTLSADLVRKNTLNDVYGYWVYNNVPSGYVWVLKLRTGVSKNPIETTNNKTDLFAFKASVDTFMKNKDDIVQKVGTGIISTIASLYLVPELVWSKTLAALLTIVSSAIAYSEGKAMYNAYQDSIFYFDRVSIS
ncbi:geobacillin-26 family protein [Bacillus sp. SM2101]|uniref:geobacillin-26 family protein n=1 Tax=Bacillus sp. SM2101 TaxID=2805366 RepID=UPI001BDE9E90|nr:geobacillin-26 family protein [Bacillus sp. SM2101]